MEKNKRVVIIISIVILTIISIIIVFKKDTSVVEKNKVSKIERKEFSIYKEQTYNGEDWKESNDTAFPTSGYLLNVTESKCYGYNDEPITPIPVTQELTKGSIDGRVTIESSNTIYCVLYFDLDNKVPEVNEFSITGKTSSGTDLTNGYTYSLDVTYKGNWLDEDVVQYCISDNNQSCSNWTEISNKDITVTSPSLTNGDGEKTMYIYLKDKANNISVTTAKSTAKIIVDQTKPVVKTFALTGTAESGQELSSSTDYTHKVGITYDATITENNIDSYCVYEESCSYQTTSSTTLTNKEYSLKDTEGSHSVKIKVKDKAGNESDIETKSITLDKTNPTAEVKESTKDTSSITVTVGYSGNDSIIGRQCRIGSPTVEEWKDTEPDGSCKISNLSDGTQYTIQARVRDASGRWNTNYPSVSVTTDKAGFSGTGKQLISYNPKGLSSEPDCQEMYRFVGHCDAADNGCNEIVDNFVCFGYTDISQCSSGVKDNEYVYRIIGISSSGEMKLIKNKALSTQYPWNNYKVGTWGNSSLYKNVNGDAFLTNLSQAWQNEIISKNWPNDVMQNHDAMASSLCIEEREQESISAKIGLITTVDYYYADNGESSNCYLHDRVHLCTEGWLDILRNGCTPSFDSNGEIFEFTMTIWGSYVATVAHYVKSSGVTSFVPNYPSASVRPVFYLYNTAYITSGSGTSTDPFIVGNPECPGCGIIPIP